MKGVDEEALLAGVQAEAEKQWESLPRFHWQGLTADEPSPPSFPWGWAGRPAGVSIRMDRTVGR